MSQSQTKPSDDTNGEKCDNQEVERPTAQNPSRGCGHLKHGKGYIRSAPDALDLPAFVEIDPRLPYKEGHFRGYRHFPGMKFEMSVMDRTDFLPRSTVKQDFGRMYGIAEGDHIGEMDISQAQDLIMWVGKSYYDPDEFIEAFQSVERESDRATVGHECTNPSATQKSQRITFRHARANHPPTKRRHRDRQERARWGVTRQYAILLIHTEGRKANTYMIRAVTRAPARRSRRRPAGGGWWPMTGVNTGGEKSPDGGHGFDCCCCHHHRHVPSNTRCPRARARFTPPTG